MTRDKLSHRMVLDFMESIPKDCKRISYNDGRAGHAGVEAEILDRNELGMTVQFADRADTTRIQFGDPAWMQHIQPAG